MVCSTPTLSSALSRRSFLVSSSALGLGACAACPDFELVVRPAGYQRLGDAHAHLFNAADLPVLGFIKYVIGPAYFPNAPGVILAIANVFLYALKLTAISARREMRLRVPPWEEGEGARVSLATYVDDVADQIDAVIAECDAELLLRDTKPALLPEPDAPMPDAAANDSVFCGTPTPCESSGALGELGYDEAGRSEEADEGTKLSMVLLATILAQTTSLRRAELLQINDNAAEMSRRQQAEQLLAKIRLVDRANLRRMMESDDVSSLLDAAEAVLPPILRERIEAVDPAAITVTTTRNAAFDPLAILKWGFKMRQSRCAHLLDYIDFIEEPHPPARTPTPYVHVEEVVNLLVDYDYWLGDQPGSGSNHNDQIAFWSRMREVAKPRITIHTFAGYDPLKETYSRLRESSGDRTLEISSYLASLRDYYINHRDGRTSEDQPGIQGMKLYPVMGFTPDRGNCLPTCKQAGRRIRRNWLNEFEHLDFGEQIDATLDIFFGVVADHDIPLLTHARFSNDAVEWGSRFASIGLWRRRAERHFAAHRKPLRLCLGHYTLNRSDYDQLGMMMAMNRKSTPEAQVFYDVSYGFAHGDPYDASSEQTARRYVESLEQFARVHDPECKYLVFGTDWIMVAQEKLAPAYMETAYRLISNSEFFGNPERTDRLFSDNLKRFLRGL